MTPQQKTENNEHKGRSLFKKLVLKKISPEVHFEWTETHRDFDCMMNIPFLYLDRAYLSEDIIVEVKVREQDYDEYIIDIPKIRRIQESEEFKESDRFWFCIFSKPHNKAYIWDFSKLSEDELKTKKYNIKKYEDDEYSKRRYYDCFLLPTSKAHHTFPEK